jgi:transposase
MKCYAGIDLHSNNAYIAVINENGKLEFKKKTPNDLTMIINNLEKFKSDLSGVVVESTFNWYWLVDGLQASGYNVSLANPCACQQYKGLKYSNDKTDAIWLAEMLRLGILPTGYIYPKEDRSIRDLLRKRALLMKHRSALLISLKGFIHNWSGSNMKRSQIKNVDELEFETLLKSECNIESAKCLKRSVTILEEEINRIEKIVHEKIHLFPSYKNLMSIWGIGKLLASMITLETGNIHRFPDAGHYASYCRCVGSKKISNEKKKGAGNSRNGNSYLAWAYIEAAYFACRFHAEARRWFDKKAAKRGRIVAAKALSNKIARAAYFVMRDQVRFDALKLFA